MVAGTRTVGLCHPARITGGKFETFDIYSGYEEFLFLTLALSLVTISTRNRSRSLLLKAKKIQYWRLQIHIDRELGTLILMGWGQGPVDVKGAKVHPELLMKIVRRPSGNFMDENAAMQEADIPIHMDAWPSS